MSMFLLHYTVDIFSAKAITFSHEFLYRPTLGEVEGKLWQILEETSEARKLIGVVPCVLGAKKVCVNGRWGPLTVGCQLQNGCHVMICVELEVRQADLNAKVLRTEDLWASVRVREDALTATSTWIDLRIKANEPAKDTRPIYTNHRFGPPAAAPLSTVEEMLLSFDGVTLKEMNGVVRILQVIPPATRYATLHVGLRVCAVNGFPIYTTSDAMQFQGPFRVTVEAALNPNFEEQMERDRYNAEIWRRTRRDMILQTSPRSPQHMYPLPDTGIDF
eukprot:TRINITY_DN38045_c0_g1_i1.p1 TRINITY_DN38045_c0_g1~~TRINITY_DN38045_c0_g1_i1.p1  ORF type:complete len:275 (+),score=43.65 TRINITY_DN38045_c0_g1_i1:37-861(+)